MRTPQEAAYLKRWQLDRSRGIMRQVDAAPARKRIEELYAAGASYRSIADQAGVVVSVITRIRDGQPVARRNTVRAILAVTYDSLFDRSGHEDFVPKIGAVRRVQALMALGHSGETIGAAMGKNATYAYNTMHAPGNWCSRERYEAVCRAYDALSMTPGTSGKTRTIATKRGYAPPLAWDDETIDDPLATPGGDGEGDGLDETAIERAMRGERIDLTPEEHLEALRRLVAAGLSDPQIATRFHVNVRTVLRWRQAHELESRWAS